MNKLLCLFLIFVSCALPDPPKAVDPDLSENQQTNEQMFAGKNEKSYRLTKNFKSSLSNDRITSGYVDPNKAKKAVSELTIKDETSLHLSMVMSAERLSGAELERMVVLTKRLVAKEMQKDPDRPLPDDSKLELATTAIRSKKMGLALNLIDELLDSKNPQTTANAHNLLGVIEVQNENFGEAASAFKKALAVEPNHEAALLNLGFLNLRFGGFDTSEKQLDKASEDWFAGSGRLVIANFKNKNQKVEDLCNSILDEHPQHKTTLYNCGLYYSKKNPSKGMEMIQQALTLRGGPQEWDKMGYETLEILKKPSGEKPSATPKRPQK